MIKDRSWTELDAISSLNDDLYRLERGVDDDRMADWRNLKGLNQVTERDRRRRRLQEFKVGVRLLNSAR